MFVMVVATFDFNFHHRVISEVLYVCRGINFPLGLSIKALFMVYLKKFI